MMTLTQYAIERTDEFVAMVAKLRKAGVVKLGALVLGPEPREVAAHDRADADPDAAARRKHDVMFAASSIRPPFVAPSGRTSVPKAVVQRQVRDEASRGKEKSSR